MNRHGQKAPEFVKRDEGSFVGLAEPEEIDKKDLFRRSSTDLLFSKMLQNGFKTI